MVVCRCGGGCCCCCDCVWFFVDDVPVSVFSLYFVLSFWPFSPIFLSVLSITLQSYSDDIVVFLFVYFFYSRKSLFRYVFAFSNNNNSLPKWRWKWTTKKKTEKKTKIENRTHKTVTHANFYRWQNCVCWKERDWHRYRPNKNRNKQNENRVPFVALWEHN